MSYDRPLQDCVTADDRDMVPMIQAQVSDATALKLKQAWLGFPVVPKPF